MRPGADHQDICFSSQRPLYEIWEALGEKDVQLELLVTDAMLVSGKTMSRTCPFCRMVAEARSGASAYAIRLERRILTINTNKVKILSRTANGEGYKVPSTTTYTSDGAGSKVCLPSSARCHRIGCPPWKKSSGEGRSLGPGIDLARARRWFVTKR